MAKMIGSEETDFLSKERNLVKIAKEISQKTESKIKVPKFSALKTGVGMLASVMALGIAGTAPMSSLMSTRQDGQVAFSGESISETTNGTYCGNFENDLYDGFGTFTFDTGETYKGNWQNGIYNGKGTMTYPDIGVYEGDYKDGIRAGDGSFTWSDGTTYVGEWQEDQISGTGTITWPGGTSITGGFVDGSISDATIEVLTEQVNGVITVENSNATVDVTIEESHFTGASVSGDVMTGSFTVEYPNGDVFVGQLSQGEKVDGLYTWADGDQYKGAFISDKMSEGVYTFQTGQTLEGTFVNGLADGLMMYTTGEKKYPTTWSEGICTDITI